MQKIVILFLFVFWRIQKGGGREDAGKEKPWASRRPVSTFSGPNPAAEGIAATKADTGGNIYDTAYDRFGEDQKRGEGGGGVAAALCLLSPV